MMTSELLYAFSSGDMFKRRVALHEASHAVVAHILGYEILGWRAGDSGGHISVEIEDPDHSAMVAIAGHAGEAIQFNMDITAHIEYCFDFDPPQLLFFSEGDDDPAPMNDAAKAGENWRRHVPAVEAMLREHWSTVHDTARQLMQMAA